MEFVDFCHRARLLVGGASVTHRECVRALVPAEEALDRTTVSALAGPAGGAA